MLNLLCIHKKVCMLKYYVAEYRIRWQLEEIFLSNGAKVDFYCVNDNKHDERDI